MPAGSLYMAAGNIDGLIEILEAECKLLPQANEYLAGCASRDEIESLRAALKVMHAIAERRV